MRLLTDIIGIALVMAICGAGALVEWGIAAYGQLQSNNEER